ncbi:hypothetical protein ACWGSB_29595 [Streptomyces albidoflavus]
MTFDQSEAEIQAHIDGPVQAAWEWLLAVVDDQDFETAWDLTAPELRRTRARAWLSANPAEEQHVEQLAQGTAPEPLRSRFAAAELSAYAESFGHLDTSQMGAASRPRVIGPDAELVVLAQLGQEPKIFTEPTLVHGLTFLMHLVRGRWLVRRSRLQGLSRAAVTRRDGRRTGRPLAVAGAFLRMVSVRAGSSSR